MYIKKQTKIALEIEYFLKKLFSLFLNYVLCLPVGICIFPTAGLRGSYEPFYIYAENQHRYWELDLGPLEAWDTILIQESSLHPGEEDVCST